MLIIAAVAAYIIVGLGVYQGLSKRDITADEHIASGVISALWPIRLLVILGQVLGDA